MRVILAALLMIASYALPSMAHVAAVARQTLAVHCEHSKLDASGEMVVSECVEDPVGVWTAVNYTTGFDDGNHTTDGHKNRKDDLNRDHDRHGGHNKKHGKGFESDHGPSQQGFWSQPVSPEPVAVGLEPVAVGPEPVAVGPEPVAVDPEQVLVDLLAEQQRQVSAVADRMRDKPVAVGPEPVPVGPGNDIVVDRRSQLHSTQCRCCGITVVQCSIGNTSTHGTPAIRAAALILRVVILFLFTIP
ncbi:hypothetical protein T484DRAFT_1754514 [Baffinella frigidus]|nr:hypothetical protein T484DRAFT_1754514 [Cryptophyta sp. CCMP2293]